MCYIRTLLSMLVVGMVFANYCIASPSSQDEVVIQHLITFVKDSGLTFIRNGQEHDSASAAEHISNKYNQLRQQIGTPEEFIDRAASKSMLSGQPYLVQLPDGTKRPVSEYLQEELRKYGSNGK